MTNRITKSAGGADGVHRLIDMVVEEVSLVDRAANQHRFLIVKRDDAMDDNTPSTDNAEKATTDGTDATMAPPDDSTWTVADGSPLGAALAALESLTAIVDLLGSLGADSNDMRLAALAEQLRATAEQILERSGFATPSDTADAAAPADVQARAKIDEPAKVPGAGGNSSDVGTPRAAAGPSFAKDISAAKQALSRLAELTGKATPPKTEKRQEPVTSPAAPTVTESLAKLAESFRLLAETVKEQQQRLGRVEKQFGLPNSAAPAEHVSKASVEDVGWPLDLNKPKDRENVDKAVSFHDL
jgi:hypothetical protein